MKKEKVWIQEETAYPRAEQRFIRACGFDLDRPKHQRMMKRGRQVREDGLAGIRIGGIFAFCQPDYFRDGKITVEGMDICCNYFQRIPEEAVSGLYLYMITAGECYFSSEENIVDFLYADMWGTAYVDAASELLREQIRADMESRMKDQPEAYLSEEFGPGYYGMSVLESKKFGQLLEGQELGIRVKDSGLMIPQKSCAGLYLVLNDPQVQVEKECIRCCGTESGCRFCRLWAGMAEGEE